MPEPRRRAAALAAWLPWLALMLAPAGHGKQLYEYVDAQGIRHFTDVPPAVDGPVRATPVQVDPQAIAHLETGQDDDGGWIAVRNPLPGPVEVELRFAESVNIASTPPLPLRRVIAPSARERVADVRPIDPYREARYQVRLTAVPGDPRTRPDAGVAYRLPFAAGTRYRTSQAFGGAFSHTDEQNRHAVDFGVAEGTPVLAARDGIVLQVERDFFESGADRQRLGGRANLVRVLHADGSMAVYAHLAYESTLVRPGSVVLAGQRIGAAGATGYATGPHLHFVVQRNEGLRLVSIPFELAGPDGPYEPRVDPDWRRAP